MSWLKRQYRRLGLRRRCEDPPDENLRTLIEVCLCVCIAMSLYFLLLSSQFWILLTAYVVTDQCGGSCF